MPSDHPLLPKPTFTQKPGTHAIILFVLALILGLGIHAFSGPHVLSGDEGDYHVLAQQFAKTGTFGTPGQQAYRAPLYPMLLGTTYLFSHDSITAAGLLNSTLGAAMVAIAGLIVARHKTRIGPMYLAALILALNSYWWLHQIVLMQENLAAVLIGTSLLCWPMASESAGRGLYFRTGLAGIFFGLSQLAKPGLVPFVVVLPVATLVLGRWNRHQPSFGQVSFFLLLTGLTVLPWTIRNQMVLRAPVPFTTGSGEVFWGAHHPRTLAEAPGMWLSVPLPEEQQRILDGLEGAEKELASSKLRWEAGWSHLVTVAPQRLAFLELMKLARLFSPSTFFSAAEGPFGLKPVLIGFNTLVLLLFLVRCFRRDHDQIVVVSLLLALIMTTLIFWGSIRFRYQLSPIIAAYAAEALLVRITAWKKVR